MSLTRKRRSTGKVTLADVAQLAGVGTMTVSRALRTPEQVSDKLREKIEAAVQELGYMPNLAASALASASSWTIAMVVPNLSEAGCSEMFAGLQQVLQPAGYQIMLAESQHRLEQEEKQESKRRKTLERELEWVKMSPKARHAKSKARLSAYDKMLNEDTKQKEEKLENISS